LFPTCCLFFNDLLNIRPPLCAGYRGHPHGPCRDREAGRGLPHGVYEPQAAECCGSDCGPYCGSYRSPDAPALD
jgi:hypothetical protein